MITITDDIKKIDIQLEGNASVFFQDNYRRYVECSGKRLLYCYSEKYIMPVIVTKKLIFIYCELVAEPYCYNQPLQESLLNYLNQVLQYLSSNYKIQFIIQTPTSAFFETAPSGANQIPFGSHVIDLTLTEDELWAKVHSKHRNVIKKSRKDGVKIVCGVNDELIEDYHSIDVETWKRSNEKATELETLKKQVRALGNNTILYLAYLDGKPQSGAFFFYNKQMCYYMYGANCDRPHTGAGNLLQWQAILDMKSKGVLKYSFVGCRINEDENSKYHGIQRFKERFGGELIQGYMFKVVFNPYMSMLFKLAIMLKNFIRSGKLAYPRDIIDQESYKWK